MTRTRFAIHAVALLTAFLIYGPAAADISGMRRALQTLSPGQATAVVAITIPASSVA